MKAWRVVRHGRPGDALELREIEAPVPGPGEARVAVGATACNLNEVDGCHGRYRTIDPPLPYTLGMEVVGVVDAVGAGAERWLGRRVTACAKGAIGAHAERALIDPAMAFDAPEKLDDLQAAALYFPFHVGSLALFERGRLAAGEWLLVNSAAGGVGSAALQLGVAAGARVVAAAGSAEKLAFCRSLGAEVTLDYRAPDFAERVLAATSGRGVDVACDLVGGAATAAVAPLMARGGRLVMAGFSGGIAAEDEPAAVTPRALLFGNFSLAGVMLAYHGDGPKLGPVNLLPRAVGDAVQARIVEWLDAGRIRPIVGRAASWRDLPAELERLAARATTGRTVLDWRAA